MGTLLLCLGLLFPILVPSTAFDAIFDVAFISLPGLGGGSLIVRHARLIAAARIVVDDSGVTLRPPRYGGWRYLRPGSEVRLGWGEIQRIVLRPRTYGVAPLLAGIDEYVLQTDKGDHVLTRTFIGKPEEAARAIAQRVGFEVERLEHERVLWPPSS